MKSDNEWVRKAVSGVYNTLPYTERLSRRADDHLPCRSLLRLCLRLCFKHCSMSKPHPDFREPWTWHIECASSRTRAVASAATERIGLAIVVFHSPTLVVSCPDALLLILRIRSMSICIISSLPIDGHQFLDYLSYLVMLG